MKPRSRATPQIDLTGSGGDSHTSDLRFHHDGQVETADYNSDGSVARRFINGTHYIDERAVLIEGDAGDGGAPADAETFYCLLQERCRVTGLMKVNGTMTEAHTFDGNGKPATDPLADFDLDGDVDLTDSGTFLAIKNAGGALIGLFTAAAGNPFDFTGRRLCMLETLPESNSDPVTREQLRHNRARRYSPMQGRWLQRYPEHFPTRRDDALQMALQSVQAILAELPLISEDLLLALANRLAIGLDVGENEADAPSR